MPWLPCRRAISPDTRAPMDRSQLQMSSSYSPPLRPSMAAFDSSTIFSASRPWSNGGFFLHLAELRLVGRDQVTAQQRSEIQVLLLGGLAGEDLQQVGAADQFAQAAHAEARQPLAGFRGDEGEEVDHHRGGADEVVLAQLVVLRRHAGGAVVQVADAQVLAAQGDHRCGAEAEALGAEDGRLDHVQAGLQAAIGLHPDLAAQVVAAQGLVGFRQAQFPGRAGVLDRGDRRGAGTAVVAGDGDQVRIGLWPRRRRWCRRQARIPASPIPAPAG